MRMGLIYPEIIVVVIALFLIRLLGVPIAWAALAAIVVIYAALLLVRALVYRAVFHEAHHHRLLSRLWSLTFYPPLSLLLSHRMRVTLFRMISYPFVVGAVAVIRSPDKDAYLLVRHQYPVGRQRHEQWGLPGGPVDNYGRPEDALRRGVEQELGVEVSVGELLAVDTSDRPRLDFFYQCQVAHERFQPAADVSYPTYYPVDQMPTLVSERHLEVLTEIHHSNNGVISWPKVGQEKKIHIDIQRINGNNGTTKHELDPDRRPAFVPLAEQLGLTKIHTIELALDPTALTRHKGEVASCCGSPVKTLLRDYTFGWGDTERLECVAKGAPVLQCECGQFVQDLAALQVRQQGRLIRKYAEFLKDQDRSALETFLSPTDIAKVRDFGLTIRTHPWVAAGGPSPSESPGASSAQQTRRSSG